MQNVNHCIIYIFVVMSKPVNQLVSERKKTSDADVDQGERSGGAFGVFWGGCSLVFIQCYYSTIYSPV